MDTNIVEIYYIIDEFCKEIERTMEGYQLVKETSKKTRKRAYMMSDSEIITIMILFHQSHCRDLKYFYINHIVNNCKEDFPHTVSYNRFVELQQKALLPIPATDVSTILSETWSPVYSALIFFSLNR